MVIASRKLIRPSVIMLFLMVSMIFTSGCGLFGSKSRSRNNPFQALYQQVAHQKQEQQKEESDKRRFSFSVVDCPLSLFSVIFSDRTGYGFAYEAGLSDISVDLEVKNASISEIIEVLSKRLSKDFILRGNTFYIGALDKSDRSIFVRSLSFLSQADAKDLFQGLLSDRGSVSVSDSCIIVSDRQQVISKVIEIFDYLSSLPYNSFICQFFIVSDVSGYSLDAGARQVTTGAASLSLTKGQGGDFDFSELGSEFEAVFSGACSDLRVQHAPMFILRSGQTFSFLNGQEYPVVRRSVSDSGTVTDTGYTNVDVGFSVKATLYDYDNVCRLDLALSDSQITGYNSLYPIIDTTDFSSSFYVEPGKIYLLGSYKKLSASKGLEDTLTFTSDESKIDQLIFFRCYRIGRPLPTVSQALTDRISASDEARND